VRVALPKLSKLDLQIMDALWTHGALSIREIHETFPECARPAYTTIQTLERVMNSGRAAISSELQESGQADCEWVNDALR
jgi:hypothetical protein